MIEIKQAVDIAKEFIQRVFDKPLPELRLEEVERSEDERFWLITLVYTQERNIPSQLAKIINPNPIERIYKTIKVDAEKGEAVGMKIREV